MNYIFKYGDRVRVLPNQGFPAGSTGIVKSYPIRVVPGPWEIDGIHRIDWYNDKKNVYVWVELDEPQFDGDGDGPYAAGEINIKGLELIDSDQSEGMEKYN